MANSDEASGSGYDAKLTIYCHRGTHRTVERVSIISYELQPMKRGEQSITITARFRTRPTRRKPDAKRRK